MITIPLLYLWNILRVNLLFFNLSGILDYYDVLTFGINVVQGFFVYKKLI